MGFVRWSWGRGVVFLGQPSIEAKSSQSMRVCDELGSNIIETHQYLAILETGNCVATFQSKILQNLMLNLQQDAQCGRQLALRLFPFHGRPPPVCAMSRFHRRRC